LIFSANNCYFRTVLQAPFTITFLGTGTSSGVPMIACDCPVCTSADSRDRRLRSSILVQTAQTSVIVDATPDFRYQVLRAGLKKLDGIVFTHPHKDHIAGLDDVRAFNYFQNRPMNLYLNQLTRARLLREYDYAFADVKYDGVPRLEMVDIDSAPFYVGDILFTPVQVWHLNMPVLGFRIGNFTYITDANRVEPEEMEKIRGSEALVLNALRREKHISHFTLGEAVELSQRLHIPQTYFTHISHQLGRHADVLATLPAGMQPAHDGLQLAFNQNNS
jgi:phosphoribosyl 1,2-cyclic phosphate phosphodiesterase